MIDIKGAELALLAMQADALRRLGARDAVAVRRYLRIVEIARSIDVAAPDAASFQRLFNGYYGVRRGAEWRATFYSLFEGLKSRQATLDEHFSFAITHLDERTGRVEASFASKIVATLDPSAPVLDSIVSAFLARHGLEPRTAGVEAAITYYRKMRQSLEGLIDGRSFGHWEHRFDASFVQIEGATGIAPMKKLDFLIWSGAR
jgi:hypothetical protein